MTLTPHINAQEIYRLERYTSLDYFEELRAAWEHLIKHVEASLDSFTQKLPADYRSRKLPEQPDIVWGELVLPNFRDTLQGLTTGLALLSHGDFKGFMWASGPLGDFRGQLEYWSGWMTESERTEYNRLLHHCVTLSSNISTTAGARWLPTELSTRFAAKERGSNTLPTQWPAYQVEQSIFVASGCKVTKGGIYVPDLDNANAEFLSPELNEAPLAKVLVEVRELFAPDSCNKYDEEVVIREEPCVWYLVERIAGTAHGSIAHPADDLKLNRILAGQLCTKSGFYFTPSRASSRRHFKRGDVMPDFGSGYGTTIWQWDSQQE